MHPGDNLGDGNLVVTTLTALCLDGEVATGYRLVELDGPPAVASLELALQYRSL